MPQTRDLGRFYGHLTRLVAQAPVVHRAWTEEIEEPFRRGRTTLVKLPWASSYERGNWIIELPNAVALGHWQRMRDIEETVALFSAVEGCEIDVDIDTIAAW